MDITSTTLEMMKVGNHPLKSHAAPEERPPRMWSAHEWKVFLDSEDAIRQAIAYVERNPENEGNPQRLWNFVAPFAGINATGWTTYHSPFTTVPSRLPEMERFLQIVDHDF